MRLFLCLLLAMGAVAAPLRYSEAGFTADSGGLPAGWTTWSARAETAQRCYVDALHYRRAPGSLAIAGNSNLAGHGGWHRIVKGVAPGTWYRFTAWYASEGVAHESMQVTARLDWRDARDHRAGQPEYVYRARREGSWTRVTMDAEAPADAAAVVLQLYLSNAPLGTVWWDDISFEQIAAPAARKIAVASINLRPRNSASAAESVEKFVAAVDREVTGRADVIVLPEGVTVVGTNKSYADVAEPVPGPTTARLGEVARKHQSWIVAGVYEREGAVVYNTAVLIDRAGRLTGRYRKVYLPREEIEKGITPGSEFPVFRTDFGTVGLMICYDVFFADPARYLTAAGAEMILMPIWGGDLTLGKARAIENKVFLVSSGYDYPTQVMDPDGEILAVAQRDGSAALATVDLGKVYRDKWLGDMHSRRMKELRVDLPAPQPGFER